nr:TetR/AcrR family transcriptional regulator [Kibdelosporangium sp. MJ126-NF4]CEL13086.1 Transcriptional regulator, TetR family [Kibdelosporangium sp. MJ126-NF4]CTQ98773.1 Transcriptional regulator, TetR family [Kibdelosporangium sp. MJ126-NF4]
MARTVGSTAAKTRQRVLEAALDLFAHDGYAGTSLRDIAERLEITKAALYYHFPSKDQLLLALVTPFIDELHSWEQDARGGQVHIRQQLRRLVAAFDDNRPILRGILFDPTARRALHGTHSVPEILQNVERLLARSDAPRDLLLARCALGTIRGAVMTVEDVDSLAMSRPPRGPDLQPRLSDADRDAVTDAAMAALHSG